MSDYAPTIRHLNVREGSRHPWIVESETNVPGYKAEICRVTYRPLATLLAAAPDLLEACNAALRFGLPGTTEEGEDVSDILRAAIAKAEGGAR